MESCKNKDTNIVLQFSFKNELIVVTPSQVIQDWNNVQVNKTRQNVIFLGGLSL